MPLPSEPLKASSESSTPVGAHGHLPAQDLFVLFAADRHHGDIAPDPVDDLQRLFDRVVVRLIHRINEVVAFNVVSGALS